MICGVVCRTWRWVGPDWDRYEGRNALPIRRCPACRVYADALTPQSHGPHCKVEEVMTSYSTALTPALHQVRVCRCPGASSVPRPCLVRAAPGPRTAGLSGSK